MNIDGSAPATPRPGVSTYLQVLAALALVVWIGTQAYSFGWGDKKLGAAAGKAKEQKVYMMSPGNEKSFAGLEALLEHGWRVTNVSVAGCPQEQAPSHRSLIVAEDPKTKAQHYWHVSPDAPDSSPAGLREQLKNGLEITHVSSAATAASAGWTYQTVFVLER